jgi:hypothetical protein
MYVNNGCAIATVSILKSSLTMEETLPNKGILKNLELSKVCDVGNVRWRRATNVFLALEVEKTICEDSTSFDFLNVHSPAYLPYPKMHLNCF